MAAGLGFKTFTTGEVLTAANVNGYLMQGINVFANTAARDAAITAPAEGQFAFTKDTNSLWYYDGAAWVASGATGDIEGVTAGIGISGGGTSGTVTVTNSMATAIDAKGDLVAGTGADAFSRIAVGANNTVLTADSAEATGLKWATPSSGGMTSLASGSLSGASVVLSSISGSYTHLQLSISNFLPVNIDASFYLRVNADATANRYAFGATGTGSTFTFNQTGWQTSNSQSNSSSNSTIIINLWNYTATSGWKTGLAYAVNNGSASNAYLESFLIYNQTPAITGLTMLPSSGNFTSGTYTLYGVK
jgi:hypothetical protein